MAKTGFRFVCVIGAVAFLTPALATEQVYHPISPTFGGNPNNGTFLLGTAQAQGEGTKSGNQGPDLSGLTNALSGLGSQTSNGTVANPTTNSTRMP
jgi:curli production assembly/transport component CsgF